MGLVRSLWASECCQAMVLRGSRKDSLLFILMVFSANYSPVGAARTVGLGTQQQAEQG